MKVSAECTNCYAESTANRFSARDGKLWGPESVRKVASEKVWRDPYRWNANAEREGVRRRVFCASMADVFEDRRDLDAHRARLFDVIRDCKALDWLLLTKRPENFGAMLPWMAPEVYGLDSSIRIAEPWPHVWLGVTAGVRSSLERVAILRGTPAAVRFISCEPILEDITAKDWDRALNPHPTMIADFKIAEPGPIHWLIVGDESGHGARPAQPDWVRNAREAALRHGVAFHFKQWAGRDVAGIEGRKGDGRKIHLPLLDGRQWAQFPAGK